MEEIHSEQPLGKEEMSMYLDKAGTLIEALPYIQHFQGATIVVKYGGSAMVDENLKRNVIQDVALLKLVGFRPIIVHGGGKDITKMLGKVGKTSEFKAGFRVTDDETMDVVEMVLNRINKSLVSLMEKVGVKACGVSGRCRGKCRTGRTLVMSGILSASTRSCSIHCWTMTSFRSSARSGLTRTIIPTTSTRMMQPVQSRKR